MVMAKMKENKNALHNFTPLMVSGLTLRRWCSIGGVLRLEVFHQQPKYFSDGFYEGVDSLL
jgi:hypothetical protein